VGALSPKRPKADTLKTMPDMITISLQAFQLAHTSNKCNIFDKHQVSKNQKG
jgi:hypothetical protein